MTTAADNPYSAYTEDAEWYDVALDDLDKVLPPFTAGLLAAAGKLLAQLAYRDALDYGNRPLHRQAVKAKRTVLALLPRECDRQDQQFRLGIAACFDALASDIEAGRAPVPRCTAERETLSIMIDRAPRLLAFSDDELRGLGIEVPDADDEHDYDAPFWEPLWPAFVTEGAEYSIPEAQPGDGDEEPPSEPKNSWAGVDYWFSPYGFTAPRELRPHPTWVTAVLDGGPAAFDGSRVAECVDAARMLGLDDPVDPWAAYIDDYRAVGEHGALGEFLTRQGAQLLAMAAADLAEQGYHELIYLGDQPYERGKDNEYVDSDTFFGRLPLVCDHQSGAWRLAMIRAVLDLRDDLVSGAAPLPRCNAEEVALHLILVEARELLDLLEDEEYAATLRLPARDTYTIRHIRFEAMREVFFQDDDVLWLYDRDLVDAVSDPDHLAMQYLHVGDLRPPSWFWTFGNLIPRNAARGFPPWMLQQLTAASTFPIAKDETDPDKTATAETGDQDQALPSGLADEFEHFTGLAQRRFFDIPCAIAMAQSLQRLLTAYLADPHLPVGRVWLHRRAVCGDEMLLVDHDFCIDGMGATPGGCTQTRPTSKPGPGHWSS